MKKQGAKKAVPRLRFPEFRNALPWNAKLLKDICAVNPSNDGLPDSFVYIDLESVEDGQLKAKNRIEKSDAPSRAQRHLRNGDVIFQVVRPYQRNNLYVDFDDGQQYVASTGYAQLRAKDSERFLYQAVHVDSFVEGVIAKCTGSNYPAINSSDLAEIQVFVPHDAAEQQKIADCLTSLDELIAAQGRKVEALKTHKRGLMQQLFPREGETRPRLRFPEFRNAPEWELHRLGDIASISKGKGISKADIAVEGRTPCIRYGELYTLYGEVIEQPLSRTNLPVKELVLSQAGDVIVPASGETKEDIATSAAVLGAGVALGGDLNIIRLNADGRFFSYYLNGVKRRALAKVAQGDTVVHLYPRQLEQLDVVIPVDKREQDHIADCLSSLDTRITAESHQLAALKNQKQGLMQQLFPVPEVTGA